MLRIVCATNTEHALASAALAPFQWSGDNVLASSVSIRFEYDDDEARRGLPIELDVDSSAGEAKAEQHVFEQLNYLSRIETSLSARQQNLLSLIE